MRKKVAGAVLSASALAVPFLGVGPADATPAGPEFGVQFHGAWSDYTDAGRAAVLNQLKRNGASTVRIDVSWRMLQPNGPGAFDPWGASQVDNAITAATSRGLKPLVTFWMAPQWASGSADELVAPASAAGLSALTDVAQTLAAKYAGKLAGWEVWNEPNSDDFLRGADPVVYANVLKAADAGFKAGDPNTPVVFGGTQYVDTDWVAKVFAAGGTAYDVMGVHPYQGVADEAPELPDDGTMWRLSHVQSLRALMDANGAAGRPMWFTEFGWSVHPTIVGSANWQRGVTAAQQADFLVRTLKFVAANYPYVAKAYWYQDRADSQDPAMSGYGLVFPDGSPTEALAAAGTYLAGAGSAPAPVSYIPAGATWKYVDSGASLATAWRAKAYADGAWKSGASEIGYGDGDERTVVAGGKLTYYFRKSFNVASLAGVTGLSLNGLFDDGAAVYLNGAEVYRYNLPTGKIGYLTKAAANISGAAEKAWHSANLPLSGLTVGTNVVAVEVHNDAATSSDISMNLSLSSR
jgi:polysaccharide biosynthesis protein PslG